MSASVSDREYPTRPWIGVGVVVWKDGEVLLIKRARAPEAGRWSLPGGAQELGETIFATAVREVLEEVGIEVAPVEVITAVDKIETDESGAVRYHYTLIDVAAEWVYGTPNPSEEVEAVMWVAPDALDRFGLWAETRRVIVMSAESLGIL
jgi:8-oxo-dGTP diphosphatase